MARKPPLALRLCVLNAIEQAPGKHIRERIKLVAAKTFDDVLSGQRYQFTWRTISTWVYRFKKHGVTTLENKPRSDKDCYRKVQVNQLAEAIHEVLPSLAQNKVGILPKSVLYRVLLQRGLFTQACVRLNIQLSHAPIRDGAAKGKIERFFRGFRDRFLTLHPAFASLEELNRLTHAWVEGEYNSKYHSGIQMIPLDRFNLDRSRIRYLTDDLYAAEVFFVEEDRKVGKTNVFSINSQRYECPVDLREKTVQVRYDRSAKDRFVVYFDGKRMGDANVLDLYANARARQPNGEVRHD